MNASVLQHAGRQLARIPATLFVASIAVTIAMFPAVSEALQYDRVLITAGEVWRVVTCHLTHWNIEHLQWDVLMFVVLGAVCELRNPKRMRLCLVIGALAVSATVVCFFPNVNQYRGLSGIDTALFTLLAVQLYSDARRDQNVPLTLATGGMLLGFVAKTAYEAIAGATIFVDDQTAGFVPLVWDHVAGAAAGAVVSMIASPFWHTARWTCPLNIRRYLHPTRSFASGR
jgi:rhomboid family GlyGly-CTERM serine protease